MQAVGDVGLVRRAAAATTKPDLGRRTFDVVVASVLLLMTAPLIVLFALALALSFRAWPFFTQTRIGRDGQPFRFLKLRTLPPSAPAYADKYQIRTVRTPAIAGFLRATHLDELPQLVLVVLGRMSLVGPRPEMPHLHQTFRSHQRAAREATRPGCAGIWQISGDNDRLISEAPEYDLFYAEYASLRLDIWVLWRTALLMLGGRRVSFDDVPAWALARPTADATEGQPLLAA
jgi:lipopolysaccharide/colanic/teichoic acid biosynthesis glycosyltransferase